MFTVYTSFVHGSWSLFLVQNLLLGLRLWVGPAYAGREFECLSTAFAGWSKTVREGLEPKAAALLHAQASCGLADRAWWGTNAVGMEEWHWEL